MPERRITPSDIAEDVRRLIEQAQKHSRKNFVGPSSVIGGGGGGGGSPIPGTPGMINPMDALGQLIRGGTGGAPTKLSHPGIAGRVLTSTSTNVTWSPPFSTFPDGTEGDILYFDGSDWLELPIGDVGQVLRVTQITPGHLQPRWSDVIAHNNVVVGLDTVVVGGDPVTVSEEL